MMGLDNPLHIAFLLLIVLLVFGAKRLPEMGHSLGAGLRGFKEAINGEARVTSAGTPGTNGPVARLATAAVDATAPSQMVPPAVGDPGLEPGTSSLSEK